MERFFLFNLNFWQKIEGDCFWMTHTYSQKPGVWASEYLTTSKAGLSVYSLFKAVATIVLKSWWASAKQLTSWKIYFFALRNRIPRDWVLVFRLVCRSAEEFGLVSCKLLLYGTACLQKRKQHGREWDLRCTHVGRKVVAESGPTKGGRSRKFLYLGSRKYHFQRFPQDIFSKLVRRKMQ